MNARRPVLSRRSAVARGKDAPAFVVIPALGAVVSPMSAVAQGAPSLTIVSPEAGDFVTANRVDITVAVENFTLDCAFSGRPDEPGVGHLHVMVDGKTMANLVNFYCGDTFAVPLTYLEPGMHTIPSWSVWRPTCTWT